MCNVYYTILKIIDISVSEKLWFYAMKAKGNYALTCAFLVLQLFLCLFTFSFAWPCMRIALLHRLFVKVSQQLNLISWLKNPQIFLVVFYILLV